MRTSRTFSMLALATALALGATAMQAQAQQTHAHGDATAAGAPAATATEQEKQALGLLGAINTSEINAANLVLQKGVQGPVREYAQRMIKEHSDNNAKIAPFAPDRSAPPATMQTRKGEAELKKLQPLSGKELEAAYMTAMVNDHTQALEALDRQLIPEAKTPQVSQHLKTTRQHVADHLAQARKLQTSASGSGNGGTAAR